MKLLNSIDLVCAIEMSRIGIGFELGYEQDLVMMNA